MLQVSRRRAAGVHSFLDYTQVDPANKAAHGARRETEDSVRSPEIHQVAGTLRAFFRDIWKTAQSKITRPNMTTSLPADRGSGGL